MALPTVLCADSRLPTRTVAMSLAWSLVSGLAVYRSVHVVQPGNLVSLQPIGRRRPDTGQPSACPCSDHDWTRRLDGCCWMIFLNDGRRQGLTVL